MSAVQGTSNIYFKIASAVKAVINAASFRLSVPHADFKTVTTISATGATTLTAAQLLGGYLIYSGNGAGSWTTPTGTLFSTALYGNDKVGSTANQVAGASVEFDLRNTGNNTLTLVGGTDVTLATGNTNTVATLSTRRFRAVLTAANTWTIYSLGVSLH